MRLASLLLYLLLCGAVSGCAQSHAPDPLISGAWLMTLTTADAGRLQVVMNYETDGTDSSGSASFHAFSEKDMDEKILGKVKARLGRMAGSNFKDGSLLRLVKGRVTHRDTIRAILVSPFGNYYMEARIAGRRMSGRLSNGNNETVGTVTATRGQPPLPLKNYPLIVDSALKTAEGRLYDPALVRTGEWQDFKQDIMRVSRLTGDDAALVMAFFYYARKLPFSHCSLYVPLPADTGQAADQTPALSEKTPEIAYLKINSFGGTAASMENIFRQIAARPYKTLIVDLRGNPGGTIEAGMAFARHLLPDTVYAGVLLTQQYFRSHKTLPAVKDYSAFPSYSDTSYQRLLSGLSSYAGICLKGYPSAPVFRGKVYILTDKRTASTCEPIVYTLKQHRLATLVGQTTAGAMLSSASFPVGQGYVVMVPTATYYASDGYKIDQQGVVPDIVLKDEDALAYVLKQTADARPHD